MKKKWTLVRSKKYTAQLKDIQKNDRKKFDAITETELELLDYPDNPDYKLHKMASFWGAKPLSQTRLVYELKENKYVHIVWVNPPEHPHDNKNGQDKDPCYVEFERLFLTGEVDSFISPVAQEEGKVYYTGTWKNDTSIFVEAKRNLNNEHAKTMLITNQISDDRYEISYLETNNQSSDLLEILLKDVAQKASQYKIDLEFQLYHCTSDIAQLEYKKSVLISAGFYIAIEDNESQLWCFSPIK